MKIFYNEHSESMDLFDIILTQKNQSFERQFPTNPTKTGQYDWENALEPHQKCNPLYQEHKAKHRRRGQTDHG